MFARALFAIVPDKEHTNTILLTDLYISNGTNYYKIKS